MNILIGKTFAIALIAGLLILASVENHADELDSYLDDAMHMQVFEELKENVQRLYSDGLIIPVNSDGNENLRVNSPGFPVANRDRAALDTLRFEVVN